MTNVMITAILSLLLAFGVDVPTVNNVRAILTATEATTTPISIVPTVISPVVENSPVYFGSTEPTNTPQVQQTQSLGAVTPACDDTPTITITPFLANPSNPNNLNDIADRVILSDPITISSTANSNGASYWPFVYFSVSAESACHSNSSWTVTEQYTSPNGTVIQPILNAMSATYPNWNGSMSVNGIGGPHTVTFIVTDVGTTNVATTTETVTAI